MIVIFVHGWSVTHTNTYGELPGWLQKMSQAKQLGITVNHIFLSQYISFDDEVRIDDIARAFHQAMNDLVLKNPNNNQRVACITHSTGGPVVRKWLDLYYKHDLSKSPLSHLIMLAPANHGSALAQLGKSRLGRIKSFFDGVEPGQHVLDFLELGSQHSFELNQSWLDYDLTAHGLYSFVLTGQKIDRQCYDAINSYTGEVGSDGVIRVASANMNYSLLSLHQQGINGDNLIVSNMKRTKPMAFGVLPNCSHSGKRYGILQGITMANAANHPTAQWLLRCLMVNNAHDYQQVAKELATLTSQTQKTEHQEHVKTLIFEREYITNRYSMILFRLIDDRGNQLNDYDLYLTAGPNYSDNDLPRGFFVDRQQNSNYTGHLSYYIDYDVMLQGLNTPKMKGQLGIRIKAYPQVSSKALAYYHPLDFHSSLSDVNKIIHPNETTMIEIVLQRRIDKTVFQLTDNLTPMKIASKPSGHRVG